MPSIAAAQTTNCRWLGDTWTCNQTPAVRPNNPPPIQQFNIAPLIQLDQQLRAQREAERQQQQQRDEADRKAAADAKIHLIQTDLIARYGEVEGNRRFRVLSMLAELVGAGRCDSARILADRDGDDQMRKSVAEECAPAGPPTSILP